MRHITVISIESKKEDKKLPLPKGSHEQSNYIYKLNLGMFNVEFTSTEFLTKYDIIQKLDTMMKLWLHEKISNTNGNK